ncbi:MAG: hypothetical protein IIT72_02995 [Lachnospiraceae bacterium]|nr:hypothetical protein [Lachnospiraceae bacterium]MCR4732245.1 hypothetical protein [Lachnospiraceae bacterium]
MKVLFRKKVITVLILMAVLVSGLAGTWLENAYAQGAEMVQTTEWMMNIPDDTRLSSITIPGTHYSGTAHVFPGYFFQCQNLSIADQLVRGYRYLDVRLGIDGRGKKAALCFKNSIADCRTKGSIFSKKLYLADVLEQTYAFLEAHPSETVIFCVADEVAGDDPKEFEDLLFSAINKNRGKWYLNNEIPSLGNVRGKVVLASRFQDANLYGTTGLKFNWDEQNNTDPVDLPYEMTGINGNQKLWVQDRYRYNTEEKVDAVMDMISNVQADDSTFTLNFLSTVGDGWMPHPKHYADLINEELLKTKLYPNTSYGVLIVDYGTKEIAQHIYMSNFKAQEPKGEE